MQLVVPDELEILPLAQFSHVDPDAYVPAKHNVQVTLPAADTLPLVQGAHVLAFFANSPIRHSVQLTDPTGATHPESHFAHVDVLYE